MERRTGAARVVVEPDVGNRKIAAKNAAAGFRVLREVDLGRGAHAKRAALSVATRADFAASALGRRPLPGSNLLASHLTPEHMEHAHRHLAAKALAEFAHERLFQPEPDPLERGPGRPADGYRLALDGVTYRFTARRYALEHWVIDPASIRRTADAGVRGAVVLPVDALELIAELQPLLQVPDDLLATYLEELSSTLASAAAKRERELDGATPSVRGLLDATRTASGTARRRGRVPAGRGRHVRGAPGLRREQRPHRLLPDDYRAYAPERGARDAPAVARRPPRAHPPRAGGRPDRGRATTAPSCPTPSARPSPTASPPAATTPPTTCYLPVHPWQWEHRVAVTFARRRRARRPRAARRRARTSTSRSSRSAPCSTAPAPSGTTSRSRSRSRTWGSCAGSRPPTCAPRPAINDWVADLVDDDETLRAAGFGVLREVAVVGYTGDVYHRTPQPNPHRKMLAALWRESPVPRLGAGERLVTMASLLHRDAAGASFATALVRDVRHRPRASGCAPTSTPTCTRWCTAC